MAGNDANIDNADQKLPQIEYPGVISMTTGRATTVKSGLQLLKIDRFDSDEIGQ